MNNNQQHPITPPQELVDQWANTSAFAYRENGTYEQHELAIATQAARWAADQELDACCNIALIDPVCGTKHQRKMLVKHIRERRRPKPPTLKDQALNQLHFLRSDLNVHGISAGTDLILRALEALPDE